MASNSESRKRLTEERPPPEPTWPRLAVVDDVRIAAGEVWHGAETCDALALLDQLETRGLKVVRA